jgi:adenosylhomocysteine nucleosidase
LDAKATLMKILIITPLQKEHDFFLEACIKAGFHTEKSAVGRLPIVRFPDLDVTLVYGGTGKAQFAVQTQHLLDSGPEWDVVICAGAAGALADDLTVGDVVVATTTVEHDYNNKFTIRPTPKFDGAPSTIASLRRVSWPAGSFNVYFGAVASGDEDIVETDRRQRLHQSTGAYAVAWEGAGGARACKFSQVPFVEIRGVTDKADHSAPSDFESNLALAMNNIAALIIAWRDNYPTR